MEIATIGFTKSSAESFFERLKSAGVERILDVRLNNVSQLAGFAKGRDLAYFARTIMRGEYEHDTSLAPTDEMLSLYRKDGRSWEWYEREFLGLMKARNVLANLDRRPFEQKKTVLLCSEATPEKCHRRLLAELLAAEWSADVEHL